MAQPKRKAAAHDDFLEFTISGSYYNSKKEKIDFDKVVGKIPYCDEDNGVGSMHVRGRFAAKWIKEAVGEDGKPKYPDRIDKLCQVFVDDVSEVGGDLSYVGKNIKDLSLDEMQELAVAKDLRFIPLPQTGMSKRDMLVRTYVAYADKVLNKTIKYQEAGFNYAKLPAIVLDGELRQETSEKITNDEVIEREQKDTSTDDPKRRFTMEELKEVAQSKNVTYPRDITYEDLYTKLFKS